MGTEKAVKRDKGEFHEKIKDFYKTLSIVTSIFSFSYFRRIIAAYIA